MDLVSNATKSLTKIASIFNKDDNSSQKKEPKQKNKNQQTPKSNLTIKDSSTSDLNFDVDDDDHSSSTSSPSVSATTEFTFGAQEKEEDEWEICHRVYSKKSMLDVEQMTYVPFIKRKKTENVLSILGYKKKTIKEVKYMVVFDEDFMYMIDMSQKENNQNNFYKKIGNHYSIKKINSIDIKDEEGKKTFSILFILDNDINNFKSITKEFVFDEYQNAVKFFNILKQKLTKFKIPLNYKNEEFAKLNNERL